MKQKASLNIAMAFVGTVIGAGIASGQELKQFFADFGGGGLMGIVCATVFFALYSILAMSLALRMNTSNYAAVLSPFTSAWAMKLIDVIIFSSLLCTLVVMAAGCGTLLQSQFHIPPFLGAVLLMILNSLAAWWGKDSFAKGFQLSVPLLLLGSILIALLVIANPPDIGTNSYTPRTNPMVGNWISSAALFVSFNMFSSVSVLVPMAHMEKSKRVNITSSLLGAISLESLCFILVVCIIRNYAFIQGAAMPMYALAASLSPFAAFFYSILMLCAIFSTTIGLTFGMVSRLEATSWFRPKWKRPFIVLIAIISLIGVPIGFADLISMIYPFFGYLSAFAFISMLINAWRLRKKKMPQLHNTMRIKNNRLA